MSSSDWQDHLARLSRVYSEETWSLYELLDRSLDPPSPDWLVTKAGEYLSVGDRILDAGCRDAAHLIRLVQTYDLSGVGIEPVAIHAERAMEAVASADLEARITIVQSTLEGSDLKAGAFDFIWCRDVLEQVEPLEAFLRRAAQLLQYGGHMLAFTVIATDLLTSQDRELLRPHLGIVQANLEEPTLRSGFEAAGLFIEERDEVGTEWREYAEERTQPVSRSLLRLARLRRQRESIVRTRGEEIYRHVESNLHWEVFQMLGKLLPIVYVLQRK